MTNQKIHWPVQPAAAPSQHTTSDHGAIPQPAASTARLPAAQHQPRTPAHNPSRKHPLRMTEPPAKRAKRTDSAAMRDRNSKPTDTRGKPRESSADGKRRDNRGNDRRGDRDHRYERDDRSRRSRSRSVERIRDRDRNRDRDRRRDRSKSRDRDGKRHVNGDRSRSRDPAVRRRRDGDKRDRERSVSGEGQRSRRGKSSRALYSWQKITSPAPHSFLASCKAQRTSLLTNWPYLPNLLTSAT